MPLKPDLKNGLSTPFFAVNSSTSLCCRRVSTKLLGQAETSEDRGMVNGGVVEWNGVVSGEWWLVMKWWFGGCTRSCLCVSFSVGLVILLSLSYVGVQQTHHGHGRPCARTIGFSIEIVARIVCSPSEMHAARASTPWPPSNAVHEPPCFE